MHIALCFIILLITFPLKAQIDLSTYITNKYDSCSATKILKNYPLDSVQYLLDSIENTVEIDSFKLACFYHRLGNRYFNNNDKKSALDYYEQGLLIRENIDDGMKWISNYSIGNTFNSLSLANSAIEYLLKADTLFREKDEAYRQKYLRFSKEINRMLANSYSRLGDFETAEAYGKIAKGITAKPLSEAKTLNTWFSIILESKNKDKISEAIEIVESNLKHFKNYDDNMQKANILMNLATAYSDLSKYEKAIDLYNSALNYLHNHSNTNESIIKKSEILNGIGTIYYETKEYDKAKTYYVKSFNSINQVFNEQTYNQIFSAYYENMGEVYEYSTELPIDSALYYFHFAILNYTANFRDTDVFTNLVNFDTIQIYSRIKLLRNLNSKARVSLKIYLNNKTETKYLDLAESTYKNLFDIYNSLDQQIFSENSRLLQAENIVSYIEGAFKVVYARKELSGNFAENAFQFMEINKASVLLQSIRESKALKFAGIGPEELKNEERLKLEISEVEKKINIQSRHDLKDTLRILKTTYANLIKKMEKKYANYYYLKFNNKEINLSDVQNYLDNETALLEYFVGDSSINVLSITKENVYLHKTKKPKDFSIQIENFRQHIFNENCNAKHFHPVSYDLFDLILKEPFQNVKDKKCLQIIPDAELNTIPFDALVTDSIANEMYSGLNFLIKDKAIGYAYSTEILLSQKVDNSSKINYGGFAPVYENETLPELRWTIASVKKNSELFRGDYFVKKECTKEAFLQKDSLYRIIHLAMHGVLENSKPLYSYLPFFKSENRKLFAADLYNEKINADLVVLTACNTGSGKIQKGEGVMSLSRAFAYAGSLSLVMTLWSVPQNSTMRIVNLFFEDIKKGESKHIAMQQAKLIFLESGATAHPFYWTGLVPTGNMDPINIDKNFWDYISDLKGKFWDWWAGE